MLHQGIGLYILTMPNRFMRGQKNSLSAFKLKVRSGWEAWNRTFSALKGTN